MQAVIDYFVNDYLGKLTPLLSDIDKAGILETGELLECLSIMITQNISFLRIYWQNYMKILYTTFIGYKQHMLYTPIARVSMLFNICKIQAIPDKLVEGIYMEMLYIGAL